MTTAAGHRPPRADGRLFCRSAYNGDMGACMFEAGSRFLRTPQRPLKWIPVGQLLKEYGFIDDEQLHSALDSQRKCGGRLGEALLRMQFVTKGELLASLGEQAGVPIIEIRNRSIPRAVLQAIPEELVRLRCVFPLAILVQCRPPQLVVATSTPLDPRLIDVLALAAGKPVKPLLAFDDDIAQAIDRHYGPRQPRGTPAQVWS
jgi:type IV pilus assembly protein PilB